MRTYCDFESCGLDHRNRDIASRNKRANYIGRANEHEIDASLWGEILIASTLPLRSTDLRLDAKNADLRLFDPRCVRSVCCLSPRQGLSQLPTCYDNEDFDMIAVSNSTMRAVSLAVAGEDTKS